MLACGLAPALVEWSANAPSWRLGPALALHATWAGARPTLPSWRLGPALALHATWARARPVPDGWWNQHEPSGLTETRENSYSLGSARRYIRSNKAIPL